MKAAEKSDRQRQYEKRAQRRTIRGLHSAIGEGKLDEVRQLLTPDIDVNFHYNQQSALQIAVLKGFLDICELLISHGADVNKQNAEGNTLLNMAVWRGHTAIVALLAKHGADLDVSNNHGSTALATAAYKGNSKIISTLVDAGCHVNKANIKGRSPLMVCAREGHVEALRALIDGECDLDWQDWDRHTALMLAAEAGHAEIVSALIDAGCDLNIREKYGCTALHEAAEEGRRDVVDTLIKAGADLNIADSKSVTPLNVAVKNQHRPVIDLLIAAKCDLNISERERNMAPIHEAVRLACQYFGGADDKLAVVRGLVAAGCNLNVADKSGWTPLCQSAFGGELEITSLLLSSGASVAVETESGDTPLHMAMFCNKPDLIKMLLDNGCDVNTVNKRNELPIYTAITLRSNIQILQLLISAGSRTDDCESENHQSPLYAAVGEDYLEAARLLIEAGCDVNLGDSLHKTPLCRACEKGSEEMVELLLKQPNINVDKAHKSFPLFLAAGNGYQPIVNMLLEAGCNVNQVTVMCESALMNAAQHNHYSTCRQLVQWGANPSVQALIRPPQRCCIMLSDDHPHLELEPMFFAVQRDNFMLISLLVVAAPRAPYYTLTLLRDLLFRTGYAQEVRLSPQTLVKYAEFFTNILNKPRLLQTECVGMIRQCLGSCPQAKVDSLPLPSKLKDRVLLKGALSRFPP